MTEGGIFYEVMGMSNKVKMSLILDTTIPKTIFRVALFDSEDENDKKDTY